MNEITDSTRVTRFCVRSDHPSLPGHFPGRPIVPGVILLSHVLDYAQSQFGNDLRVRGIDQAKFLTPLLPDQEAQITLTLQANRLRFTIERVTAGQDVAIIGQGSFALASEVRS